MRKLSARQLEVGRLVSDGLTNDEIAARLGISSRTVKAHCDRLRIVLNVERRRQLPKLMRDLGYFK